MAQPNRLRKISILLPVIAVGAAFGTWNITTTVRAQIILSLPDESSEGAKTPASAGVKSGMTAIRMLVLDAHTLITHRRLSPEAARRFAKDVKQNVAHLQADPTAAVLTDMLADLTAGADQIAAPTSGNSKLDGLDKIEMALSRYPELIDDPDWKPLR